MRSIKLMADYYCHPLWHACGNEVGDIDPRDLPISSELQTALETWAVMYDETLDKEAPQDSGFLTEALELSFKAEGHRLARCLREELGEGYIVIEHI